MGKTYGSRIRYPEVLAEIIESAGKDLSRQEEMDLALQMKKDPSLTWSFCSHYYLWAVKKGSELYHTYMTRDPAYSMADVVMMAIEELETAARKYDPTAGRFTTYSGTLIVNNIRHKLRVSKTKGKEDSKHRPNDTLSLDLDETENGISGLYRMMSSKYNCFEDAEISALFQEIATDEADYLWKYYMEGYSVRMVADYYGEKEYAVRKTIKNAEKRIRDIYQNESCGSE